MSPARRIVRLFDDQLSDPIMAARRLTLLTLVLYGGDYWQIRVPVVMVCAVGFLLPSLLRSRAFWTLLAAAFGVGMLPELFYIDNHKYLMFYWLVALAFTRDAAAVKRQAVVMIGLVFAFATVWKLRTADFTDGSFLTCSLLTDNRFAGFATVALGMSPDDLEQNAEALRRLYSGAADYVRLKASARADFVGTWMTYWTILIEGTIAIGFLLGRRPWRHWLLIIFIASTYALANVPGFSWMLCILGFVAAAPSRLAAVYFGMFLLTQFYRLPWSSFLT